jgi:hypothetical protein
VCGTAFGGLGWQSGFAKLPYTCGGRNLCPPARFFEVIELEDSSL